MNGIEKLYENANIKPEYRYDCNLADTIKPVEVFSLCSCSKGEIKDFCINKQDYRYCKVYKVNKIYPPFTAEKKLSLIILLANRGLDISPTYISSGYYLNDVSKIKSSRNISTTFENSLAQHINAVWQDLTEKEQGRIRSILK